jgi:hypothetical protein
MHNEGNYKHAVIIFNVSYLVPKYQLCFADKFKFPYKFCAKLFFQTTIENISKMLKISVYVGWINVTKQTPVCAS